MKRAQRSLFKKVTATPCPNEHDEFFTPGGVRRTEAILTDQILIALGLNLPGRNGRSSLDLCRWAVQALAAHPGLSLTLVSSWYRSRPIPASDQPDYINGVARFTATLDPLRLLAALQAIETDAGRTRSVPNAARTLDLDLLAVGALVAETPGLTLPHPRLQDRAFVLAPLCDVAPEWRHPILGRTALELYASLSPQALERLTT